LTFSSDGHINGLDSTITPKPKENRVESEIWGRSNEVGTLCS